MIRREVWPALCVLRLDTGVPQTMRQFNLMCNLPNASVLIVTLCLYHRDGAPGVRLWEGCENGLVRVNDIMDMGMFIYKLSEGLIEWKIKVQNWEVFVIYMNIDSWSTSEKEYWIECMICDLQSCSTICDHWYKTECMSNHSGNSKTF